MANAINWFELPASDYQRAVAFYKTILGVEFEEFNSKGTRMAFFRNEPQNYGACGAIAFGDGYQPSESGTLIYFHGGEDLSEPLSKVEESGGKVLMNKTPIGDNGFIAHFLDTEGNRVALHSQK